MQLLGVGVTEQSPIAGFVSAGLLTMICVSLTDWTVAVIEPNETLVAPVKPVPVMMTFEPPHDGPKFGLTFDTEGRGM